MNRLNRRLPIVFLLLFTIGLFLTGCAGSAVGIGAMSGLAAYEERSFKVIARDAKIALELRAALLQKSENHFLEVGIEVFEGRVLLTGAVGSEKTRADAVGLAWKTDNVKAVLNEIMIGPNSIADAAKDAYITAQLTSKITLDKKIMAINYSIESVAGVVYLIGIAQNKLELKKVIDHARAISYVRKVISHVRIKEGAL